MIKSMTGFGRGSARLGNGTVTVEIKTVNHKFFDASLRLPPSLAIFEDEIAGILQKYIKRGKVTLGMTYDGTAVKDERISINQGTARKFYTELKALKKALGIQEEITLKDITALPGVLSYEVIERGSAKFWPQVKVALGKAVGALVKDRQKEGRALQQDLARRSKTCATMLRVIRSRAHLNVEEYRRRFSRRIKDLTGGNDVNVGRLEMEVAIFAKNCDISEEITRLQNHLVNFNATISGNGEVGKKLDFIAQELHREINTIGSKASDFKIAKYVIEIKGEIEKIREQAKNIE